MKARRTLNVLAVAACAIMFVACGDMFEDVKNRNGYTDNVYTYVRKGEGKVIPGDKPEYRFAKDVKESFIGNDSIEYSFIEVTHYEKSGDVEDTTRTFIRTLLPHVGSPVQYFEFDDTLFTTTRGDDSVVVDKDTVLGNWFASILAKRQIWNANNNSGDAFYHTTTTGAAGFVYRLADEDSVRGYEVPFEMPSWTLDEATSYKDVTGVVYNNKTWKAVQYASDITSTHIIPEGYRVAGEPSSKKMTVQNIAYFLKHEVNTTVEGLRYDATFKSEGAEVSTEIQRVSGSLVTRDYEEEVKSEPFALDMNLWLSLSKPADVDVNSEDELNDESFTHIRGQIAESAPVMSDVFSQIGYSGKDTIILADAVANATFGYEKYFWMDDFSYAKITNREVPSVKSVRNDSLSTNSVWVNTVTITFNLDVEFVGISRPDEGYTVAVSYNRTYHRPDNYATEYSWMGYYINMYPESDCKINVEQYDTIYKVVKNNGELYSSSLNVYDIDAYVNCKGGDTVLVANPFKPTLVAVEDHPNTAGYQDADEDGFKKFWTKDSQTLKIKGGNTINYEWYYESLTKDGKTVGKNATITGTAASGVTFSEPELVDSTIVNGEIVKVFRLNAVINPTINDPSASASLAPARGTKAASAQPLTVSTPFYQKVVEADSYTGEYRIVRTYTKEDDAIKVTDQLYQTFKVVGEKLMDEKSAIFNFALNGSDGGKIHVTDVTNWETTGTGAIVTGAGNYNNNSTDGITNFVNDYTYNVTSQKVIALNGADGVINDTITSSCVLSEAGYALGEKTAVAGGIDEYLLTSTVQLDCTVGDKTVSLTADATKILQKDREIPDITGKILSAGFSVVPAHFNEFTSKFEDGNGVQSAVVCMTIIFEDGGKAIPFAFETEQVLVPTLTQIENGNLVAGTYTSDYNSGIYSGGQWIPSIATDNSWGIGYSLNGVLNVRAIKNESLGFWSWRNGNYSTQLPGYNCVVDENNVLTVTYQGVIVLELK